MGTSLAENSPRPDASASETVLRALVAMGLPLSSTSRRTKSHVSTSEMRGGLGFSSKPTIGGSKSDGHDLIAIEIHRWRGAQVLHLDLAFVIPRERGGALFRAGRNDQGNGRHGPGAIE